MRPTLRALALVTLVLSSTGCATRNVTPWFRAVEESVFDEVPDAPYAEQLVRGRWIRVSSHPDARAFRHGELVLYRAREHMLTNEHGDGATLDCAGEFSILPRERGFVCVSLDASAVGVDDTLHIGHRVFDLHGNRTLDDTFTFRPGELGRPYVAHQVGYLDDATPLVSLSLKADGPPELGDVTECRLYALRPGSFEELLRLTTPGPSYVCSEAAFWTTESFVIRRFDTM